MDVNKALEEKLDQYLLGRMNEAEKADFVNALENNPELAAQLDLHQQLAEGVKLHAREDFRNKLKNFQDQLKTKEETEVKTKEEVKVKPLYRRIAGWAAAAAVLLLLVTMSLWMSRTSMTSQEIYAQAYEPYPSMFSSRAGVSGDLPRANEYYQNEVYGQALIIFDELLTAKPNDARLLLMSGICLLEEDQAPKAFTYFQKIIELKDIYLSDQATWYAALSLVKQDQKEAAIPLLQQLADQPKADRKKEATELLKLLR